MLSNYTDIHIVSSKIYGPIPFSPKYVAKPSTKDIRKLNTNIGEQVLGNYLIEIQGYIFWLLQMCVNSQI